MTVPTHTLTPDEALASWFTPPRLRLTERNAQALAEARNFTVRFGAVDVAVSQWGQAGPLALLVHGWGGHRGQMTGFVAPLLAAGYRVVAFDAPAHGETPGEQTHGFESAAALLAVVAEVGRPYAVIAHSFGTLVATIALQQGLTTDRLVFFGALRRLSDALEAFVQMNGLTPKIREYILRSVEAEFGTEVWDQTALDIQLPGVAIPALLIHDRDDEITPFISSVAIQRAWPAARLVATHGLGHRRALEDEDVHRQVVEFLAAA
ncbi:MAG: alpha/beta fold hydrolase [Chloroflexi bacterium]|nr:alpha/beta fold hydrolase [Chloroflexota bacterium]